MRGAVRFHKQFMFSRPPCLLIWVILVSVKPDTDIVLVFSSISMRIYFFQKRLAAVASKGVEKDFFSKKSMVI